jgi:hypothetical protein
MKKLLTLTVLLGAASLSFGQGLVNFANSSTTRISTNSVLNGPVTGLTSGAVGSYYYALFVATSSQNTVDASLTGWTYVGTGANTATVGRLNGNTTTDPGIPVPGYALGSSTADFVVVGWSGNAGSDINAIRAWWNNGGAATGNAGALPAGFSGNAISFAISSVAQDQIPGGGGQPIPAIFSATLIPNMTLNYIPVPEPTSFALLGLGAGALAIFRRRK